MAGRLDRILVVDDEPDMILVLKHMLSAAGYDVLPAYGGEDALRKLRRQRVALVLTDLAMPRVSGIDLIEAMKADPELADTPIICVTAFVWDTLGRTAGDLGCDGFVAKPVDRDKLLDAVRRCLDARRTPECGPVASRAVASGLSLRR